MGVFFQNNSGWLALDLIPRKNYPGYNAARVCSSKEGVATGLASGNRILQEKRPTMSLIVSCLTSVSVGGQLGYFNKAGAATPPTRRFPSTLGRRRSARGQDSAVFSEV